MIKKLKLDANTMPVHKMTDLIDKYAQKTNDKISLSEDDDNYFVESRTIIGLLDDLDANVDSPIAAELYLSAMAQAFHRHGASLDLAYRWSYHRSRMWVNQQYRVRKI